MVLRRVPGKGVLNKLSSFGLVIGAGLIYIGESSLNKLSNLKLQDFQKYLAKPQIIDE